MCSTRCAEQHVNKAAAASVIFSIWVILMKPMGTDAGLEQKTIANYELPNDSVGTRKHAH